ncbi:MAG TPA: branched-chain amino acid dehydrogenase [Elusimicrobia bacterium]|nr:branched-chain amino acid dehydrogenase [Elusimicrobiota bacterium]
MKKILSPKDAVNVIHDKASIMVSGFMCCGQALRLIDALLEKGSKDLTLITNDSGFPDRGVGKLIVAGRVKKLIVSHIGLNPEAGRKMNAGEMEVELVPQGTLAERIRCSGAGLGGVLTPTGLGTEVEKGKQKMVVDGQEYLLERQIHADFAFLKADTCDRYGNAFVAKSGKNFNLVMAMAAQHAIVETDELVPAGGIDPEKVTIPGVFVNSIAWEGKP